VRGRGMECEAFEIMGFGFDGAWAQYVVVPAGALTSVPEGIPFEQAAVLADAVSTPYAALTARAGLRAGESIGLCKMNPEDVPGIVEHLKRLVEQGELNEYYERAFQELIKEGWQLKVVDVGDLRWVEVDDHNDLARAALQFA